MPATITLEENDRVLHIVFSDPLTVDECIEAEQQGTSWADSLPYNLHTFLDVRDLHHVPQGFLKLREAAGFTKMKSGTTVILGASIYLQRVADIIFTLTGNRSTRFFPADAADQAMGYLRQIIVQEQYASAPELN